MQSNERKTTELFIEHAVNRHGDKYSYKKVCYEKNNKKVIITCQIHGDFEQTPLNHLTGRGCHSCGLASSRNNRTLTTEKFIKRAKDIHGEKYGYEKVEYKSTFDNITIECKEHGGFHQRPVNHIKGSGCPKCGFKRTNG